MDVHLLRRGQCEMSSIIKEQKPRITAGYANGVKMCDAIIVEFMNKNMSEVDRLRTNIDI